ncbi:hypothetical protein Poli38472_001383 [Pythium oligandrum]|uniref:Chitin-binding type-4 domain-containing protein n=1 Tax=Pythium oligandrum TaxID=41045 RepID=A0A8K1FRP9_PYTOL|nr:hypothetical protein Poli38472_001383 [Pythium oligandrum]|eukprot:TMW69227.1 hypothetical protein Poli38472_001383 [Pythium oligandrum]
MKVTTILTTVAVATPALFLAPGVHAHGGMVVPEPRAIRTMGLSIDSTFGHPISVRAAYTNGKGGDCLDFTADTNLQSIPVGTSKIQMRTNDGANHIGPCTMYLVNPSDKSKKQQIGQLNDCMRSLHPAAGNKGDPPIPAEMTINVPENPEVCGKDHCVLEFYWEATHLDPHELFNNCADVKIGGGGSSGSTTTAPAPAATSAPAPAATTAPATGGGSYVYSGPARADSASMTTWCNQNCPSFCPTDICKAA